MIKWLEQLDASASAQKDEDTPGGKILSRWYWPIHAMIRLPHMIKYDPDLLHEIKTLYAERIPVMKLLQNDIVEASAAVDAELRTQGLKISISCPAVTNHANCQRTYGITLAGVMILNCILRCYDPADAALVDEAWYLMREVTKLADDAKPYRPLGASFIGLCLTCVHAAAPDDEMKLEAERIMDDYYNGCLLARGLSTSCALEGAFDNLRAAVAFSVIDYESLCLPGVEAMCLQEESPPLDDLDLSGTVPDGDLLLQEVLAVSKSSRIGLQAS